MVIVEVQAYPVTGGPAALGIAEQGRWVNDRDLNGQLRQARDDVAVALVPPVALYARDIASPAPGAEQKGFDSAR